MARTQGQTTKGESVKYHTPALLQEVIDLLDPKPDKKFIDATIGGGGHTLEILKRGGKVLGIDRDPDAIEHVKKEVHSSQFTVHSSGDLVLVQENFNRIGQIAKEKGFEKVNGILFDLGVSSHQLEAAERGFSFFSKRLYLQICCWQRRSYSFRASN